MLRRITLSDIIILVLRIEVKANLRVAALWRLLFLFLFNAYIYGIKFSNVCTYLFSWRLTSIGLISISRKHTKREMKYYNCVTFLSHLNKPLRRFKNVLFFCSSNSIESTLFLSKRFSFSSLRSWRVLFIPSIHSL